MKAPALSEVAALALVVGFALFAAGLAAGKREAKRQAVDADLINLRSQLRWLQAAVMKEREGTQP